MRLVESSAIVEDSGINEHMAPEQFDSRGKMCRVESGIKCVREGVFVLQAQCRGNVARS